MIHFLLLNGFVLDKSLRLSHPKRGKDSDFAQSFLEIQESWRKNMEHAFFPKIFDLGNYIVDHILAKENRNEYFETLDEISGWWVQSEDFVNEDVLGRLYHQFLLKTKGSFYAPYYSSIPSSLILSSVAFLSENPYHPVLGEEFTKKPGLKDEKRILNDFHILDPACGSGYLLKSCFDILRSLLCDSDDFSQKSVNCSQLLNVIWGFDVMPFAIQLAKSSLFLSTLNYSNKKYTNYTEDTGRTENAERTENNKNILCRVPRISPENLYLLPNGINLEKEIHLGALDFLKKNKKDTGSIRFNDIDNVIHSLPADGFDLIIMNPPFSRSAHPNLKFGYEEKTIQRKMSKHLRSITRKCGLSGIGQAGLGANFIYLAHTLLKKNGRMAFIIPRAILSGVSWQKIRELLFLNYHIEYIFSNFDIGSSSGALDGWNWSENTDLGEVMLVVRKKDSMVLEKNKKPQTENKIDEGKRIESTTFLNFIKTPKNRKGAMALCDVLIPTLNNQKGEVKSIGDETGFKYSEDGLPDSNFSILRNVSLISSNHPETADVSINEAQSSSNCFIPPSVSSALFSYEVPRRCMSFNFHFPCLFLHPKINDAILSLYSALDGNSLKIEEMVPKIGRYLCCGRDIKQIKTHFHSSQTNRTNSTQKTGDFLMVEGHQTAMNTLCLDDKHLKSAHARNGEKSVALYEKSKADLLVATRPHLNTERLLACETSRLCVATAFWEIKLAKRFRKYHDFLLLWFNSTFGFLLLLGLAVNSKAQIFKFKKTYLQEFPVPKSLSSDTLEEARKIGEIIKNRPLPRFLDQFKRAREKKGLRYEIDRFIQKILNDTVRLNITLEELYPLLTKEPSLTLKGYDC